MLQMDIWCRLICIVRQHSMAMQRARNCQTVVCCYCAKLVTRSTLRGDIRTGFLMPKILVKFQWNQSNEGAKYRLVGWVKLASFDKYLATSQKWYRIRTW